jgi:hypothetical protein
MRSGMFIPDPGSGFFLIPDPGVQKAPDPGSGSEHWFLPMKGARVLSFDLYIFVNFKIITEKMTYFLDVIRICEPTTVVQIYSRFHRKVPVPTF